MTSSSDASGVRGPWKRTADDLIAEILDLVQVDDADNPGSHPWEELAEAARRRGVDVALRSAVAGHR